MKLIAFCEASADFQMVAGLVDRVLRDVGPTWVVDAMESSPEAIRAWEPDGHGHPFFDIHRLNDYATRLGVRPVHGHFHGKPGGAGAAMARKAFRIARASHAIDAVVFVWDIDQQPERQAGVDDARQGARAWASFHIVCGHPDPEREAWVLAGFDPCDDHEQKRLHEVHQDLGFSPILKAGHLRDKDRGAVRNIKRVLGHLTANDRDREARCWTLTSLETLRTRGADTGLTSFLNELEAAVREILQQPTSPA